MTVNDALADRTITISREISAPLSSVWKAWTEPEHLIKWWGPDGFTNTFHAIEVREGGHWVFTMHGPDGEDYPNRIVFTEILPMQRIAFVHDSGEGDPHPFQSEISFIEADGKVTVTLTNILDSKEERDRVVEEVGAIEGGKQTLGRLAAYVESM